MADWPGNPIGKLFGEVSSASGGINSDCSAGFNGGSPVQTVSDVNIVFSIDIEYYDHSFISSVGHFSAELFKLDPATGTEQSVDYEYKYLPLDQHARNGHWWDKLSLSVTMTDPAENYRIHIHVDVPYGIFESSENNNARFQAIQSVNAIGNFTLDFVPLTIVYCPPGQDMTNAVSQSQSFGTKFTIGNTSAFQSETSASPKIDILGLLQESVGFSGSQSLSNQSTSGIQVSAFRNTIITADNQKAVGRAYWGPLNDIFVILVNPTFAASRRADGTMFYSPQDIEQVLLIPARKLLRPDGDPIAEMIPEASRLGLLQLDPFITNLNLFFPDSGADLSQAANPYADPSPNNRAELIGRWWLDGGTIVSYSVGETVQLLETETNQLTHATGVSINATAGVNYDDISAALGLGAGNTTSVGIQSSKENDAGYSSSVACYLIRNQNDRDLSGIELYFDKIFSTFMFRRLLILEPVDRIFGVGALRGTIRGAGGLRMRAMNVTLVDEQGKQHQTSTRGDGSYSFFNLMPGNYTLIAGDQQQAVAIPAEATGISPVRQDLEEVRRLIDLQQSPIWEISRALGLPSETVREIVPRLAKGANLAQLGKKAGVDQKTIERWQSSVILQRAQPKRKKGK